MLIWPSNSNNEYLISRSGCRDYLSRNAAAGIPAALYTVYTAMTLNVRLSTDGWCTISTAWPASKLASAARCDCNQQLWWCSIDYVGTDFDDSWNKQLVDRYFSRRHSFRRLKRLPFSHFFVFGCFVRFLSATRRSLSKANASRCLATQMSISLPFQCHFQWSIRHSLSLQKSQFIRFQVGTDESFYSPSLPLFPPVYFCVHSPPPLSCGWIPFDRQKLASFLLTDTFKFEWMVCPPRLATAT